MKSNLFEEFAAKTSFPAVTVARMLMELASGSESRVKHFAALKPLVKVGLVVEKEKATVYFHNKPHEEKNTLAIPSEFAQDALEFMAKNNGWRGHPPKGGNILQTFASAMWVEPGFVASSIRAAQGAPFDKKYEASQKTLASRLVRLGILGNGFRPAELHKRAVEDFLKEN